MSTPTTRTKVTTTTAPAVGVPTNPIELKRQWRRQVAVKVREMFPLVEQITPEHVAQAEAAIHKTMSEGQE